MSGNPTTELLRPHVRLIEMAAKDGNARAQQIIDLYRLYLNAPGDRCAAALCQEAFKDWQADLRRESSSAMVKSEGAV